MLPARWRRQPSHPAGAPLTRRVLVALPVLVCLGAPSTTHADATITSSGPIKQIVVGADLSCQVSFGDASFEFFPPRVAPGDCGTFLSTADGGLYAPNFTAHGGTATGGLGGAQIAFTPVSQSDVVGVGTAADPFVVDTTVRAGSSGLELRQRVSYVTGEPSYLVDTTVSDQAGNPRSTRLFYAADCYASGSDIGYGFTRPEIRAAGCSQNVNNVPAARTVQLSPLSAGSSFLEDFYRNVWQTIGTAPQQALSDSCRCLENLDNGIGLSWEIALADGSTTGSRSLKVSFTEAQPAAPPVDTDGDSLPDTWELGNGPKSDETNLAPLGADPNRPDIFVHADHMAGCAPTPGWERQAIDMFAKHGVNLHIDAGPESLNANLQKWGTLSRAGELPYSDQLDISTSWGAVDAQKDTYFLPANRRRAFHYVLFANTYTASRTDGSTYRADGGQSRGTPDADIISANCGKGGSDWKKRADAVVVVHEIGHNLGLRHGGADEENHKSNYHSLMNYSWAWHDVSRGTLTDFSSHRRPDVDESQLSERTGLQTPTIWWCDPKIVQGETVFSQRLVEATKVATDLDLDCDGRTGEAAGQVKTKVPGTISIPLIHTEFFSSINRNFTSENLVGHDDWSAIQYGGGGIIGALTLPPRADTPPVPELTSGEIAAAAAAEAAGRKAQAKQIVVKLTRRSITRRRFVKVFVRVLVNGEPVRNAIVTVRGARISRNSKRRTSRRGVLQLKLRATSRNDVTVSATRRNFVRGTLIVPVRN